MRTRARRDGDTWLIDGRKTWNSAGHVATHQRLAVRTGEGPSRHDGISILIVANDAPGVSVEPIDTWGGVRLSEITFTGVHAPATALIGQAGEGWRYINGALDEERVAIGASAGSIRRCVDDLVAYTRRAALADRPLGEYSDVRRSLASIKAEAIAVSCLRLQVAREMDAGHPVTVTGTMAKVATTELRARVADVGLELLGRGAHLRRDDPDALLSGVVEQMYRFAPIQRFGGGTNEVMRDIIAQRGFGLPRSPRRRAGVWSGRVFS